MDDQLMDNIAKARDAVLDSARLLSDLTEKGTSNFLLAFGVLPYFLFVLAKIVLPLFPRFSSDSISLSTDDFITVAVVSSLFVCGGVALRIMEFLRAERVAAEFRDAGLKLIEKTHEAGLGLTSRAQQDSEKRKI